MGAATKAPTTAPAGTATAEAEAAAAAAAGGPGDTTNSSSTFAHTASAATANGGVVKEAAAGPTPAPATGAVMEGLHALTEVAVEDLLHKLRQDGYNQWVAGKSTSSATAGAAAAASPQDSQDNEVVRQLPVPHPTNPNPTRGSAKTAATRQAAAAAPLGQNHKVSSAEWDASSKTPVTATTRRSGGGGGGGGGASADSSRKGAGSASAATAPGSAARDKAATASSKASAAGTKRGRTGERAAKAGSAGAGAGAKSGSAATSGSQQHRAKVPKTRMCEFEGCEMEASFGYEGERRRTFCSAHKLQGMINVKHKQCLAQGCSRQPSYGIEGGKAQYCSTHRVNDMVNLVHRRCKTKGCSRLPAFGKVGQKASYCASHRTEDMVDVTARRCQEEGCTRTSSYSFAGNKVARYCSQHKKPGMLSVKGWGNGTCIAKGCQALSMLGATPYCSAHVTMASCVVRGCNDPRIYGPPGGTAMYCEKHKEDGMAVCLDRCRKPGCPLTSDGVSGFCEPHAAEDMICGGRLGTMVTAAGEAALHGGSSSASGVASLHASSATTTDKGRRSNGNRKRAKTGSEANAGGTPFSISGLTPGAWGGDSEEEESARRVYAKLLDLVSPHPAGGGAAFGHAPGCDCSDCAAWRATARAPGAHNPLSPHNLWMQMAQGFSPLFSATSASASLAGAPGGVAADSAGIPFGGGFPPGTPCGFNPLSPMLSPMLSVSAPGASSNALRGGTSSPWHPLPMFWHENPYTPLGGITAVGAAAASSAASQPPAAGSEAVATTTGEEAF